MSCESVRRQLLAGSQFLNRMTILASDANMFGTQQWGNTKEIVG